MQPPAQHRLRSAVLAPHRLIAVLLLATAFLGGGAIGGANAASDDPLGFAGSTEDTARVLAAAAGAAVVSDIPTPTTTIPPTTTTTIPPTTTTTAAPATTTTLPPPTTTTVPPPPPAPVATVPPPPPTTPPPPPCQRAFTEAVRRVPLPPGWVTRCEPTQPGMLGSADPKTGTVTIYERPGKSAAFFLRVAIHEIGHAIDFDLLTEDDRRDWMSARGNANADWYPSCDEHICEDFDSYAGDWAEAVAWVFTPETSMWKSRIAGPPNSRQVAVLRTILARHGY